MIIIPLDNAYIWNEMSSEKGHFLLILMEKCFEEMLRA